MKRAFSLGLSPNKVWAIIVVLLMFSFLPSKSLAALTITNVSPSVVNSSDEVITITATASGLQNSTQYLEVAFTKEGESSNYFGLTKNQSEEWYQYKSSPVLSDLSSYFYKFTPVGGSWSGEVLAKIDSNDSGFKGAGNYLIKLVKYITSSAYYSNSFTIAVNITPTPTSIPTPTNTPTPAPTDVPTSTPRPSPSPTVRSTPTDQLRAGSPTTEEFSPTSILEKEATSSVTSEPIRKPSGAENGKVLGAKQSNFPKILIGLGVIFLIACGILVFRAYKNKNSLEKIDL